MFKCCLQARIIGPHNIGTGRLDGESGLKMPTKNPSLLVHFLCQVILFQQLRFISLIHYLMFNKLNYLCMYAKLCMYPEIS